MVAVTVDDKVSTIGDEIIITGTCDTDHTAINTTVNGVVRPTKSLSGVWRRSLTPYERTAVVKPAVAGEYCVGPHILRLPSGRVQLSWRQGASHVDPTGVIKHVQFGNDYFLFNTANIQTLRAEAGLDVRGHAYVIDPRNGRIFMFYTLVDSGGAHQAFEYIWTDDEFDTINGPVDVTALWSDMKLYNGMPYCAAYDNGFLVDQNGTDELVMPFYSIDACYLLYLEPDGVSWGRRQLVYDNGGTNIGSALAEPIFQPIDDQRVICIIRDQANRSRYRTIKSSDGCQTFTALDAGTDFTNSVVSVANQGRLTKIGDDVMFVWAIRSPDDKLVQTRINADVAFADPTRLFDINYADNNREDLYSSRIASSGYDINFGNPSVIPHANNDYTAHILFYEQDATLDEDITEIRYMTAKRLGE